MNYQKKKGSCGPAALCNALEALGVTRGEEELAALCKTTSDGTGPGQLRKAIATIEGLRDTEIHEGRADVAMAMLLGSLYEGHPVIVCVDNWEHWACAVGTLGFGKRVVCVDSGDSDLVVVRALDAFEQWWRGPEGVKKPYYGVVL